MSKNKKKHLNGFQKSQQKQSQTQRNESEFHEIGNNIPPKKSFTTLSDREQEMLLNLTKKVNFLEEMVTKFFPKILMGDVPITRAQYDSALQGHLSANFNLVGSVEINKYNIDNVVTLK